jgi:hypothetical protein
VLIATSNHRCHWCAVVATQTRSIQAPVIAATNCNRFCGLAARWNANVQTMVLPRVVLTAEEVAAAVGQQAMFQELASALVEIRQPGLTRSRSSPRPLFADRYRGGKPLKPTRRAIGKSREPCSLI